MSTVTITIPIKTVSEANRSRDPWYVKQKRVRQQRLITMMTLKPALKQLQLLPLDRSKIEQICVQFTRLSPGILDDDNLSSAFKAIRDEVAKQLGIDDGSPIYKWAYGQQKVRFSEFGVLITIDIVNKTEASL